MDKHQQRQLAYAARNAQPDKDLVSEQIMAGFMAQPCYQTARTVLWYVHCRSEVRTLSALTTALQGDKRIVVPYCTEDADGNRCLGLWHLRRIDELQAGTWGILEPPPSRWLEAEKIVQAHELDLLMVPGVAFDSRGGRLGNGAGYYDRLLVGLRPDTVTLGVGFQCQMLPDIVKQAHDQLLDFVLTERQLYACCKAPGG